MHSPTSSPEKRGGPIRSLTKSLGVIRNRFSGKTKPEFTVISASKNISVDEQDPIDEGAYSPLSEDNAKQLSELGSAFDETARYPYFSHARINSMNYYRRENYIVSEFDFDEDEFNELIAEANQLPEDESVRREDLDLAKREGSMHRQLSQLTRNDSVISFFGETMPKKTKPTRNGVRPITEQKET